MQSLSQVDLPEQFTSYLEQNYYGKITELSMLEVIVRDPVFLDAPLKHILIGFSTTEVGRGVSIQQDPGEDAGRSHGADGMGDLSQTLPRLTHRPIDFCIIHNKATSAPKIVLCQRLHFAIASNIPWTTRSPKDQLFS